MPTKSASPTTASTPTTSPAHLRIKNFAHIKNVDLLLGDLTVLVGPQGAGKSLALQWLKAAVDGGQLVESLKNAGLTTEKPDVLLDFIFGTGMASAWRDGESEIKFEGKKITPRGLKKIGDGKERLFFVPAHRSMLISDGWALPFQKLSSDTPVVARIFSQNLYERFNAKDAGSLFPVPKLLKEGIRSKIDDSIFHKGTIGIEEDRQHARRLRLAHGDTHLPFMTWSAGQREFTPLLLGLYHLLPSTNRRKRGETDWVVLEEPEMGLHPQAVTAAMLLVLDLLWRGYRVVIATHSPHIMTMLWMMRQLQENDAGWRRVTDAFEVGPAFKGVAEAALWKDYRAYALKFDKLGQVYSSDISSLDTLSDDDDVAGWGGLTHYSSLFGESVRKSFNERKDG